MKKIITIALSLLFILTLAIYSYGINMDLLNDAITDDEADNTVNTLEAIVEEENSSDEDLDELFEGESNNDENAIETNIVENKPTSTVTADSTNENFFTAENIINVILIAVGIVLIFLGIAILIRLK